MGNIKLQSSRSGCKDVFKSFLVKNANYEGYINLLLQLGLMEQYKTK